MKWFQSDRHRQHDPEIEIWAGLPGPATEVPARAEAIAAALAADGTFDRAEATEHGLGPVERIHDPALVRWLEEAWAECRPLSPQREVIPDTVLHPGFGAWAAEPGAAPLGRLGYWCFDTMTPLVEGTYARGARRGRPRAVRARRRAGRGPRGLRPVPAARAPRGHVDDRRVLLLQQRRRGRRGRDAGRGARRRWPSWTWTTTTATAPSRSSTRTPRSGTCRCTATRSARSPTTPGGPPKPGRGRAPGPTTTSRWPRGAPTTSTWPSLDSALDLIATGLPAGLVVSLGFDTYRLDPICDLGLTTARVPAHRATGWQTWGCPPW